MSTNEYSQEKLQLATNLAADMRNLKTKFLTDFISNGYSDKFGAIASFKVGRAELLRVAEQCINNCKKL